MNQIVLIGRLTRDIEFRSSNSGSGIARMSLAVNKSFKKPGEPEANFFNLVAFGKTAENAANHLGKGRLIGVTGELSNNHYEDKNGVKHYGETILVSRIEFLDYAKDNQQQGQQQSYQQNNNYQQPQQQQSQGYQQQQPQQQNSQQDFNGFQAIDGDSDIPF